MAKSKSTGNRRQKKREDAQLDKTLRDFEVQPAQLQDNVVVRVMLERQPLHNLAEALELRYPGVQVTAELLGTVQELLFTGLPSVLLSHGLLPEDSVERPRRTDEFGTKIYCYRGACPNLTVQQLGAVDGDGGLGERGARSHPDNKKTRAAVAKILKQLQARGAT